MRGDGPALTTMSTEDAYAVQAELVALRCAAAGASVAGHKVGCTSRAVQQQFGLRQPVRARILDREVRPDGAVLPWDSFVDPAVEAEFILRVGTTIDPTRTSDADLFAALDGIAPAIELHHYRFFHGEPSSAELIASNAIHAGVVIGTFVTPPDALELEGVGCWVNGDLVASALAAEILGAGPLASLRWLVAELARLGERVEAGQYVLPGSAVPLVRVEPGDRVEARFTRLGRCRASFR